MQRFATEAKNPSLKPDVKIVLAAFFAMVAMVSIAIGIASFIRYFIIQNSTTGRLERDATQEAFFIDSAMEYQTRRADLASGSGPVLHLAGLSGSDAKTLSQAELDRNLRFLRVHGFTAIAVQGKDGDVIRSGTPLLKPALSLPFKNSVPSTLMWQDGFYLRTVHPVRDSEGMEIGTFTAEQPLEILDETFHQEFLDGSTSRTLLCGASATTDFACLANRPSGISPDSKFRAIRDAFAGGRWTASWVRSSSGLVVLASAPVGTSGLAITQSISAWEAFVPFYIQVAGITTIVGLVLAIGWFLLKRDVEPLVAELINERNLAKSNGAKFIAAAEGSLNPFFIFESARDARGEIVDFRFGYLNHRAEQLVRRKSSIVLGKSLCEEIPITRSGGFFYKYKNVVETGIAISEEFPISSADINASWLQYQVVRLGDGVAITASDISSRKAMEAKLENALGFSQAIIDAASFAIVVTDLEGTIIAVNPAAQRMLGYTKAEMVGNMTPLAIHDPLELVLKAAALADELGTTIAPTTEVLFTKARSGLTDESQWTYIRKDGSRIPVQLTMTALVNEHGGITGYMGVSYDITERKRHEEYVSHIAHHDSLTGLPTRLLFTDRVDVALNRIGRYGGKCAVMLIDLDDFKDINDSLGHPAGDEVLVVIARRLQAALRKTDTVSRLGGDEFTVLLDTIAQEADAIKIADKLLEALSLPIQIGDDSLTVSASIGISTSPEGGNTTAVLLKHADTAMYHAKRSGKQSYSLFTKSLADATTKRLQMEMALRKGLELGEFRVVYQPQVSVIDGAIVGVEALARWDCAKLGSVPPSDFIPVAEQSGVIAQLGEWVLRTACKEISQLALETGRHLRLAVNLSPRQLDREDFPSKVSQILDDTGFLPSLLEVEITEGILMSDSLAVWDAMRQLGTLGLQTVIDDFGTGFSNVSYLLKLAVNRIKIDQTFIACLEKDPSCNAVVSSLINMAHSLGVCVVAEGVETEGQRAILVEKGCDEAQGYLFYRPISLADLKEVLMEDVQNNSAILVRTNCHSS